MSCQLEGFTCPSITFSRVKFPFKALQLFIPLENGEVYSALIAVVGANLILLAYVLTAFSEVDEETNTPVTPTVEKKNQ